MTGLGPAGPGGWSLACDVRSIGAVTMDVDGMPRGRVMRVLVVEDSDVLRHLLARVLKNVGCEVVEAADAYDALGTAGVSPPDLVVTDLMMPGLDGVGLIPRLRAMPGPATVPVVVVTAAATAEAERAARAAGATAFLAKPVDTPELLGCIGGCL